MWNLKYKISKDIVTKKKGVARPSLTRMMWSSNLVFSVTKESNKIHLTNKGNNLFHINNWSMLLSYLKKKISTKQQLYVRSNKGRISPTKALASLWATMCGFQKKNFWLGILGLLYYLGPTILSGSYYTIWVILSVSYYTTRVTLICLGYTILSGHTSHVCCEMAHNSMVRWSRNF